jgi:hypothetical protein
MRQLIQVSDAFRADVSAANASMFPMKLNGGETSAGKSSHLFSLQKASAIQILEVWAQV